MSTIDGTPRSRRRLLAGVLALSVVLVAACSDDSSSGVTATSPAGTKGGTGAGATSLSGTVKLGFFPNVTHAPALVGVAEGTFTAALGDGVDFQTFTFDSGTTAAEALLAGSLDLTFIGPNPAINAYAQSGGKAVRIVAGSTSGGAYLVVKPGLTSAAQLKGKTIATPSLGNTQDVALRSWLKDNGIATTADGGGDVTILPQKNATTLESFVNGSIAGAWVPEPWATRLIAEGGGKVLVDERDLWKQTGGQFVTTHLIVRTEFLGAHPDLVKAVIEGLSRAIDLIDKDPAKAQSDVVAQIKEITGSAPKADTIGKSFANLTFTLDPIAASLQKSAADAVSVGLLKQVDLHGIYDLTLLNEVLKAIGKPEVKGL
ncbi:MAG: ABC transporter substrate-binding protein [Actinomycetota bacterium]